MRFIMKDNTSLMKWIYSQRKRKGNLKPERISLLDALDFKWSSSLV